MNCEFNMKREASPDYFINYTTHKNNEFGALLRVNNW